MKGLLDEGNDVYVLPNNDPKRKLKYGLEIIKTGRIWSALTPIWLIE
jgi:DNA-binding sugar fermentation-stimulating protein